VTTRTLRFYEQQGLIAPIRRGRTRLYRAADRTRLMLVLRGKRLGFTLAEIREIVDMYGAAPGEVGQLQLLLARIAERRAELEQKKRDIEQTLAELDSVEDGCRHRLNTIMGGRD
jgi:DNA-binding transcriptional MerR regulator